MAQGLREIKEHKAQIEAGEGHLEVRQAGVSTPTWKPYLKWPEISIFWIFQKNWKKNSIFSDFWTFSAFLRIFFTKINFLEKKRIIHLRDFSKKLQKNFFFFFSFFSEFWTFSAFLKNIFHKNPNLCSFFGEKCINCPKKLRFKFFFFKILKHFFFWYSKKYLRILVIFPLFIGIFLQKYSFFSLFIRFSRQNIQNLCISSENLPQNSIFRMIFAKIAKKSVINVIFYLLSSRCHYSIIGLTSRAFPSGSLTSRPRFSRVFGSAFWSTTGSGLRLS